MQLALALGALFEVARRFLRGSEPEPLWMMGVAAIALVANVSCLRLIARHRHGGAHMKASYIFSTNDVIANIGVIAAGVLVVVTESSYPDLVVGVIIGAVVLSGAVRILRIPAQTGVTRMVRRSGPLRQARSRMRMRMRMRMHGRAAGGCAATDAAPLPFARGGLPRALSP